MKEGLTQSEINEINVITIVARGDVSHIPVFEWQIMLARRVELVGRLLEYGIRVTDEDFRDRKN